MVTVIVPCEGEARRYTLPSCTPAILEQLERACSIVEQAQRDGRSALRLTFNLKGKSAKIEVASFFD